jgi:hypothetical protein
MKTVRNWIVGLTVVALLAVGVVALAGNGFGGSTSNWSPRQAATGDCDLRERDADGAGILNCEDPDWARPTDGSGYGEAKGCGHGLSADRPLDGTGFGAGRGGRMGPGIGERSGRCF